MRVGYKADLGRAQILYGARRYPEARASFAAIQSQVSGDERELVDLRIAECDFFLKRYQAARDGVRPYLETPRAKSRSPLLRVSARSASSARPMPSSRRRGRSSTNSPRAPGPRRRSTTSATYYILTNEDELAGGDVPGDVREVPDGDARRTGGVEVRLVSVQDRRLRRDGPRVRELPRPRSAGPTTGPRSLLGGACARQDRQRAPGGRPPPARQADYGNSYYGRLGRTLQLGRRATDQVSADAVPANAQSLVPQRHRRSRRTRLIRLLLAAGL